MPRLFVAVDIPPEVKDQLQRLQTPIPTARWVNPAQMHLTLRFIGADVPATKVAPIQQALAAVVAAPFTMRLHGMGRFPPGERTAARVLWVGIAPEPALLDLHHQVEIALASVGFPPEDRPFAAHITLARLKAQDRLPQVRTFLEENAGFTTESFPVTQFILVESTLSSQGPSYRHVGVYPLALASG